MRESLGAVAQSAPAGGIEVHVCNKQRRDSLSELLYGRSLGPRPAARPGVLTVVPSGCDAGWVVAGDRPC
jgi:hypothetical protein